MTRSSKPVAAVRCAIYTRKSTEDGLQLDFNSLDAQRECAEAYIKSQQHAGWACSPERFDDGGFTGGNTERPALKRLLAAIDAGQIDMVVVYKVDRLSRSLTDFAKMAELFQAKGVSFVSVTQQIDTSTSQGRLMLNVLLSFAQFEREMMSERTRDKIAAARRKGKWSGGHPLLGYDIVQSPGGSKLEVNDDEALRVREVFKLYLREQALIPTVQELNRRGWLTKQWMTRGGKLRGGRSFDKGSLFQLLTNQTYLGRVRHKDQSYPGEHQAIVPAELFGQVQERLGRNGRTGGADVRNKYGAVLKGILRCKPCGCSMNHSYSSKDGRTRYRYYVCQNAAKRGWNTCPSKSVPAQEIEQFVVDRIKAIGRDPDLLHATLEQLSRQTTGHIADLEAERATLQRQLKRSQAQIQHAAADAATSPHAVTVLADLHEQVRVAQERRGIIEGELAKLRASIVEEGEVAAALVEFEVIWANLCPREQTRLVQLLVKTVEYDGANGKVAMTLHPGAFEMLAESQRKEQAA